MSQSKDDLKAQRATCKGCMRRIKNYIEKNEDCITLHELECRMGLLEAYFKQAFTVQGSYEKLNPTDASNVQSRSDIEDLYCSVKSKILQLISAARKKEGFNGFDPENANASFGVFTPPQAEKRTKLPPLQLPHFSGNYTEFSNFLNTFLILVDGIKELSEIEKLQHLRGCLSGQALETIRNLDVSPDNYKQAIQLLKDRYDNPCIIFQAHVRELFKTSTGGKTSAHEIRTLLNKFNSHLRSLKSIGSPQEILDAFLIHMVTSKLDSDTIAKWENTLSLDTAPSWEKCSEFLNKQSQFLENKEMSKTKWVTHFSSDHSKNRSRSTSDNRSSNKRSSTILACSKTKCVICTQDDHSVAKCPVFATYTVMERYNEAKKHKLCLTCLTSGHMARQCKSAKCQICKGAHHTSLHRFVAPTNNAGQQQSTNDHRNMPSTSTALHCSTDTQVILATAIVNVKDSVGHYVSVRAVLDSGSHLSFMTEKLAKRLKLKMCKINGQICAIGGLSSEVRWKTNACIKAVSDKFETSLQTWILPRITGVQPDHKIDTVSWQIPSGIKLADEQFNLPQKIELLLGADIFFDLLLDGQIKLGNNRPTLQNTVFGYIVSGNYETTDSYRSICNLAINKDVELINNFALHQSLEKFWAVENVDTGTCIWSQEQKDCEQHFVETVTRADDGRFIVTLPFKKDPDCLGESFQIAERRFRALENRLNKNLELKSQYEKFINEYKALNHMVKVPAQEIGHMAYFMPHQCVLRPDSTSTKLRVVFDASCRTSQNISLNETLMVGPTIQDDLFSIILRFRKYRFALTGDITKMYRQIMVKPEDTKYQCILWRNAANQELEVYRLTTVTYGTASAPFHATRCLKALADENMEGYPIGAKVIASDLYMDDLISGADSIEQAKEIQQQVEMILLKAKFNLRKWYSNHEDILAAIPESERETLIRINDEDVIKTLGIIWEPTADEFHYFHAPKNTWSSITKRSVLSDIAQIFDPLGIVNPVTVMAKTFMQELWVLKINWDEELPQELTSRWIKFKTQLSDLNQIKVPRYLFAKGEIMKSEIHGFADASIKAYGCCLYMRYQDINGNINVNLICAKSKVAPLQTLSLPRLELLAAHLLAKLYGRIKSAFQEEVGKVFMWTDSELVLNWISAVPSTWTTFVANRVAMIQEFTKEADWKHVNSSSNPADIISRGALVKDLVSSSWLTGPPFLYKEEEWWPMQKQWIRKQEMPEKRKSKTVLAISKSNTFQDLIVEHKYANNFQKLRRIFSYVIRFIRNMTLRCNRKPLATGNLLPEDLEDGMLAMVFNIQQNEFRQDIDTLQNFEEISPQSRFKNLNPFLDNDSTLQLLRVGGRLQNADLPYHVKHPILIPQKHPFTDSYISYLHLKNCHAGTQSLVALLRDKFWIVNAKGIVKKIVHRCIHCYRYKPKLLQQIMGNLPRHRIEAARPFYNAGVDFCGPIYASYNLRGKRSYKTYLAVFICFSTKATHIEVVTGLSSSGFIAALKRFIARRGICANLYCDNATNFVGARTELADLKEKFYSEHVQHDLQQTCAEEGINFHHIPPRSPHFGGLWESTIKIVKIHLYKKLNGLLLTFEELCTVVAQVEAILNSRPLVAPSTDPNDETVLTPAHFLIGQPLTTIPEPSLEQLRLSSLDRWQRITALQQYFWKRWYAEYVKQLQVRYKWSSISPDIQVGKLVLLADDNAPPQRWTTGRIIETVKGKDNHVRVVLVKTKAGVFKRAIHRVAPLPVEVESHP